jgi:aminoglycoside phosphotransferase family enzyme/predicted kinase
MSPETASLPVDALLDALSDPAAYPHAPDSVELVQTHISVVALVPPWVYKVKKPVDFGFLDFTTREKRRAACEDEVRLNRRLCAETYRGVVPLVRTDGGLRVNPPDDTDAPVVDHAVKMRYMPPEHFLHNRVEQDRVTRADVDRVARRLADFYGECSSSPEIAEEGWIERIRVSVEENFEQTADLVGRSIPRPTYDALRDYTDRFLDQQATLLHRRRAGGFIVEGHGDLRLGHVHLTDERICIYDCIEFNERFRRLDWASDIAFLAMDFDVHGRPDLERHFVDRMQEALGDPDLPRLLDFYKSYRAYVRAKVEGMQAAEDEVPADERAACRQKARRYVRWALRYAVAGTEPRVVVVMGRPGTGKSTQARAVADALGWRHAASDLVRKHLADLPTEERASAAEREQLYTPEMTARTYARLRELATERARNGQSTVLDATYSARAERDRLRAHLQAAGVPHVMVECTAPDDVLRQRLATRDAEGAHGSDARAEDFNLLDARYDAPSALEDARHVRVSTEPSPDETTTAILKHLIRFA